MKKKLIRLWIALLVVVCCLGPFIFTVAENRYNKYAFERMLEESKYIVEEELPIWLGTERLTINASCTFSSRISDISGTFYWRDSCETTIHVDDELDARSDREQHSFLSNVEDNIEQYIQIIMKKHYPQYTKYDKAFGILQNAYGKHVSHELNQKIIVKTSHNTYEFNGDNNYYTRNGEIVSLSTSSQVARDEGGNWSYSYKPTVKSKDGKCCFGSCDSKAKAGSAYCHVHSCCKDDCPNEKDNFVHCCDEHNCIEPGCGQHRYDYANSKYCTTHYVNHYND